MKILVPIKRVLDYNVKPRLKPDGSAVDLSNVKMSINPFDEIALEEAVRLKEKSLATEIVLVSIGDKRCLDSLRSGLAMGADRGIYIDTDESLESLNVAKILHHLIGTEHPDLVICGKQSIDTDHNQTPQMLAGIWGVPQATFISSLTVMADGKIQAVRDIEGGLEYLELTTPCVVSADLRLNTPRYVSLPNIMKAKSKPIQTILLADLGLCLENKFERIALQEPFVKSQGVIVPDTDSLMQHLKPLIKQA